MPNGPRLALARSRVSWRAPVLEPMGSGCLPGARDDILELDEFPPLARCLVTAERNRRGMTSRSPGEGGQQERDIAQRHRETATSIRHQYPRTADALDALNAVASNAAPHERMGQRTRRYVRRAQSLKTSPRRRSADHRASC